MKHKNTIIALGIMSMALLIVQSANAAFLAYTKAGYPACASLLDFDDVSTCFLQRDSVAVNKIIEQGRCILLKPDIKVWAWYPKWAEEYTAQIRFPGSPDTLWTFRQALEKAEDRDKARAEQEAIARSRSKHKRFALKSLLWIEAHKTTRQELLKKYPNPFFRDEAGGEYAYAGNQYPDFKEWYRISFIFDGAVLYEIRAEK